MTRLTAAIIIGDPNVYAGAVQSNTGGKFGLYIGTIHTTPSGCQRIRPLITSEPIFETAAAAEAAAEAIIAEVRAPEWIAQNMPPAPPTGEVQQPPNGGQKS